MLLHVGSESLKGRREPSSNSHRTSLRRSESWPDRKLKPRRRISSLLAEAAQEIQHLPRRFRGVFHLGTRLAYEHFCLHDPRELQNCLVFQPRCRGMSVGPTRSSAPLNEATDVKSSEPFKRPLVCKLPIQCSVSSYLFPELLDLAELGRARLVRLSKVEEHLRMAIRCFASVTSSLVLLYGSRL